MSSDRVPHEEAWKESSWRSDVRRRLLAWFEGHARVLPWRSDPTPYRVWISEIMLQQTQVATVLPYFDRFIEALPDVESLAAIEETELMRLWEGLGYYRRARSMHAAAKRIVSENGGRFPTEFDQLLALPGIGRYTAGAILSISNDQRLPILEGNTQRVFSRWIGLRGAPMEPAANRLLWQVAEAMLPRRGSGRFNQAAMELGALVCTPRAPACDRCPVRLRCAAESLGLQEEIPGRLRKLRYEDRTEFAFVVENEAGGYLVREIPLGRRWSGLWDFPRTAEQSLATLDQAVLWLAEHEGVPLRAGARELTQKHAVTRFRITLHVHAAHLLSDATTLPAGWRWANLKELGKLAMNVTGRRITQHLAHRDQLSLGLDS